MSLTSAWTTLRKHETQGKLWTCAARFVGASAGRGSGKTELAKRRLVRYLPIRKPWGDPRYFYGAPTEQQAKRIAWRHLLSLIPKAWIRPNGINRSDLRIETIFGSELWVIGLDRPQRVEGNQWDGCVLDESCDLKPGVFDTTVLPMLTHRNGWCWRIGVPKRQGASAAEFREFCEKSALGELEDSASFTWPSSDILPDSALRFAQTKMTALDYREQMLGLWVSIGGNIFYAFDREYNVRPCAYDPKRQIVVGSDFNVDPMAWTLGHRFDNRIEWFDELFLRNTNTQSTLDALYARYSSHSTGFEFYGDATGKSRHTSASESDYTQILNDARFRKLGRTIHYPKSNPAIADRFASCNTMFRDATGTCKMFIDPRCENLIRDVESRHYKPGTNIPNDSKDLGHLTDAMGYPTVTLFPSTIVEDDSPIILVKGGM